MAKKHNFNFSGGEYLSKIGASYYVCYLYSLNCDPSEKRWTKIKNSSSRNKKIKKYSNYSSLWLKEISKMKKVYTNSMGLTVFEVNKYADELLKIKSLKFD